MHREARRAATGGIFRGRKSLGRPHARVWLRRMTVPMRMGVRERMGTEACAGDVGEGRRADRRSARRTPRQAARRPLPRRPPTPPQCRPLGGGRGVPRRGWTARPPPHPRLTRACGRARPAVEVAARTTSRRKPPCLIHLRTSRLVHRWWTSRGNGEVVVAWWLLLRGGGRRSAAVWNGTDKPHAGRTYKKHKQLATARFTTFT